MRLYGILTILFFITIPGSIFPQQVTLKLDHYEQMLRDSEPPKPQEPGPFEHSYLIRSIQYEIQQKDDYLHVSAWVNLSVFRKSYVAIPLWKGIRMFDTKLEGEGFQVVNQDGFATLFGSAEGFSTHRFDFGIPLIKSAGKRIAEFTGPGVVVQGGTFKPKKGWTLENGAAEWIDESGHYRIALAHGYNKLILKEPDIIPSEDRLPLVYRLVTLSENSFNQHRSWADVSMKIDIIQGIMNELEFSLPDGGHVSRVEAPPACLWEQKGNSMKLTFLTPCRHDTGITFRLSGEFSDVSYSPLYPVKQDFEQQDLILTIRAPENAILTPSDTGSFQQAEFSHLWNHFPNIRYEMRDLLAAETIPAERAPVYSVEWFTGATMAGLLIDRCHIQYFVGHDGRGVASMDIHYRNTGFSHLSIQLPSGYIPIRFKGSPRAPGLKEDGTILLPILVTDKTLTCTIQFTWDHEQHPRKFLFPGFSAPVQEASVTLFMPYDYEDVKVDLPWTLGMTNMEAQYPEKYLEYDQFKLHYFSTADKETEYLLIPLQGSYARMIRASCQPYEQVIPQLSVQYRISEGRSRWY